MRLTTVKCLTQKGLVLAVLGLVLNLDLADVCFAFVEVIDIHDMEVSRKAPDGDSRKGRLPAWGDRDRGGHMSIIVLI